MRPLTTHFKLPTPEFSFASFTFPRWVGDLPKGSKADRLRQHKKPICGPYYHAPKPEKAGTGKGFYFEDSSSPFSLRWGYCDEVDGVRIDHTGWWADTFQDTKIRGLVFRLPRSRGFLAGWTMGKGMASAIECDIYETAEDAARAADSLAEMAAEEEREAQEEHEREEKEAEEKAEREELESLESARCSAD